MIQARTPFETVRRSLLFLFFLVQVCLSVLFAQIYPEYRLDMGSDGSFTFRVPDQTGTFVPLLSTDPDRSSRLFLGINGKVSPLLSVPVQETSGFDSGMRYAFSSSSGKVRVDVWAGDNQIKALPIYMTVKNDGDTPLNVSVGLIFNTILGETGINHFYVRNSAGETAVSAEQSFDRNSGLLFVDSRKNPDAGSEQGLILSFPLGIESSDVLFPDSYQVANCQRLQEEKTAFKSQVGRNFSWLPFSINDSGLLLNFPGFTVLPGESQTLACIMAWEALTVDKIRSLGSDALQGIVKTAKSSATSASAEAARKPSPANLAELNSLLAELRDLMEKGAYAQADVERIIQRVQELSASSDVE